MSLFSSPTTREQLKALVEAEFGIRVPDEAICSHHNSPMDYLAASFFGQDDLLIWANRGGGKTSLAAVATMLDAIFRAPIDIRVLGGSFDQSDRLADCIRSMLDRHDDLVKGRRTRTRIKLVTGADIRMLPQSQRAVRGQHVQKIRCDEVDLFDPDVWRAVQFVTQSCHSARGSIEVLSTLHRPGGLMHQLVGQAGCAVEASPFSQTHVPAVGFKLIQWCLWEVIERCPSQRRCQDCLLAEDCRGVARRGAGYFRIDDAVAIKARSSKAAWEAEMLCRGPHREYLVLAEFDPARHVAAAEWCDEWPTYRAIDFGYRNPLVCLWIQLSPDGRVFVMDEYVRSRLPLNKQAAAIIQRDRPGGPVVMTYVDPAGRQKESTSGKACTELLAAAGIPCVWRASTVNEGLELIRAALAPAAGEPTLVIHPRCTALVHAFNTYHYPPPGAAGDQDKPVKDGPDHLIDALRYFFVNRFRPRIAMERGGY